MIDGGFQSLEMSGLNLLVEGVASWEEIERVVAGAVTGVVSERERLPGVRPCGGR